MYRGRKVIDTDRLKEDMKNDSLGAYYGGGFGGALMESFDVDSASSDELIRKAQRQGIDLREYEI